MDISNDRKKWQCALPLKSKEIYKVSQTAIDNLIPDLSQFFCEYFETEVKQQLQTYGLNIREHPELQDLFGQEECDPFKGLQFTLKIFTRKVL